MRSWFHDPATVGSNPRRGFSVKLPFADSFAEGQVQFSPESRSNPVRVSGVAVKSGDITVEFLVGDCVIEYGLTPSSSPRQVRSAELES